MTLTSGWPAADTPVDAGAASAVSRLPAPEPQPLAAYRARLRERPVAVLRVCSGPARARATGRGLRSPARAGLPGRDLRAAAGVVVVCTQARRRPHLCALSAPRGAAGARSGNPRLRAEGRTPHAAAHGGRRDGRSARRSGCGDPARSSRPRHPGALLCLRPAPQRAGGAGSGGREPARPHGPRPRQGRQGTDRAVQSGGGCRDSRVPSGAARPGAARSPRRNLGERAGATNGRPAIRQLSRRAPVESQRRAHGAAMRDAGRRATRHQPARPAALLRDAPAGARGRPARHPGAARPCPHHDNATLHARQRRADGLSGSEFRRFRHLVRSCRPAGREPNPVDSSRSFSTTALPLSVSYCSSIKLVG